LKNIDVYLTTWWTIDGKTKVEFYRFKHMAKEGQKAKGHGNLGLKKLQKLIVLAIARLQALIISKADEMPHKTRTLASGEKVHVIVLPSSFS